MALLDWEAGIITGSVFGFLLILLFGAAWIAIRKNRIVVTRGGVKVRRQIKKVAEN